MTNIVLQDADAPASINDFQRQTNAVGRSDILSIPSMKTLGELAPLSVVVISRRLS